MKIRIFILILISLGFSFGTEAQSISEQVIGNSGLAFSNGTFNINFTVGETMVSRVQNGATIHQGFWSELFGDITLSEPQSVLLQNLKVYPNPVENFLTIAFKKQKLSNFKIYLYDSIGKPLAKILPSTQLETIEIPLTFLPVGLYLLRIEDSLSNFQKTYKIVKR